ncbi:MAG: hypothetical protein Q9220_005985 [cf. Caloplaca sp. 1 TL-2023]
MDQFPWDEKIVDGSSVATVEDSKKARETAIRARLTKISRQQNVEPKHGSLDNLACDAVIELQEQRTNLHRRRLARPPIARAGPIFQKFLSTFSQFMKTYHGLNEIAKGVHTQYGSLVIGTLSVLTQIAENKEGRERAIDSIFEGLTRSWIGNFGRLSLYLHVNPSSSRMQDFLADVYLGAADLALESAEYYSRPPYIRFWQAVHRPPKLAFEVKADEIKKAIFEVVSEANACLIYNLAKQEEERKKMKAQQEEDQIAHIARNFGISRELADADRMIKQCKALHANAFAEAPRRKRSKRLQQISLDLLKDGHASLSSGQNAGSSALVLSGLNYDMYDSGYGLCWLSPITTEIAELYQSKQQPEGMGKLLFHSACKDESSRFSTQKEPFDLLLSLFIIQVLLWNNDYFSKHRQFVEDNLKGDTQSKIRMLQTLLKGWTHPDGICIIVDRLDRIAFPDDDDELSRDGVTDLLETILETVSAASCNVKLVVTVKSSAWPCVTKTADLEERWKIWSRRIDLQRYSLSCKVHWNQPEIQSF